MNFSEEQKRHILFMKTILEKINQKDLPLYLKGGTSLLLCYDLDRFSEDIDLNSNTKLNLESIFKESAKKLNIEIVSITKPKDTDTTQRYKIQYKGNKKALKVETSLRKADKDKNDIEWNENDIIVKNGIKVFTLNKIIEMKLKALQDRTTARDFHDVSFLLTHKQELFSISQKEKLFKLLTDDFISGFVEDYIEDDILSSSFDNDHLNIINFLDSWEEERHLHKIVSDYEKTLEPTLTLKESKELIEKLQEDSKPKIKRDR